MFLHFLALKLCRTKAELLRDLSIEEFSEWVAYFTIDGERRKKLMAKAKLEAKAANSSPRKRKGKR